MVEIDIARPNSMARPYNAVPDQTEVDNFAIAYAPWNQHPATPASE